jgi:hypothetical protein
MLYNPAMPDTSRGNNESELLHARFRESYRLWKRSRDLYGLARMVSEQTQSRADSFLLLRKSILQLFVAVLRFEGKKAASISECVDAVKETPELRKLFSDVIDDIDLFEAAFDSFDLVLDSAGDIDSRYDEIVRKTTGLHNKVRRYLIGRFRAKGGNRWRTVKFFDNVGLAFAATAILLVVGVIFAVPGGEKRGKESQKAHTEKPSGEAPKQSEHVPAEKMTETDQPVPGEILEDPQKCLRGTYFKGSKFEEKVLTRRDCRIKFYWPNGPHGSPAPGVPPEHFSIRWEGNLTVPRDDRYTFYLTSDDGGRLFIDNKIVLDNWGDHPLSEVSREIELKKDVEYRVRIDYYDAGGEAGIRLSWSSNSMTKETVSGRHFSPPNRSSSE